MTLRWDPNGNIPDGYRLFERESEESYDVNHYYDVGNDSNCTVYGLEENKTYHFVVRAYAGLDESADSNEATYKCTNAASGNDPNPPSTPSTELPADATISVGLEPILTTSAFTDPDADDTHTQTRWQIFRGDTGECIYDVVSNSSLTTLQVPESVLEPFTMYDWTARHYSQRGGISEPAPTSEFSTSNDATSSLVSSGLGGGSFGSSDGLGVGCFIQSLF